jgi:hypothetical protein
VARKLQEEGSRKGAKAQRKAFKELSAFKFFACSLCAFAPLRENFSCRRLSKLPPFLSKK